jgi:hypothetical protein
MRRNGRFWLGMALYAVVLLWSVRFLRAHPESEWRIPIALAPVAPIALVVANGIRQVRELDELQKRQYLEAAAFAYPTMVVGSIAYGFLQNVGFPNVNWMFVGVFLMALFGVGRAVSWWKYH